MKNFLIKSLIALCALAIASSSFAGKGNKKAPGYRGKITAVADGSITVSNKKLGDKTYQTNSSTKVVKLDGSEVPLTSLQKGALVRVITGADTSVATEIQAIEKKKKPEAAGAPGATPTPSAISDAK